MHIYHLPKSAALPVLHINRRLTARVVAGAASLLVAIVAIPTRAQDPIDPRAGKVIGWIQANSDPSGLPFSHVGDDRLRNWTFTYDAASTALAYLAVGKPKSARKIIDYYIRIRGASRLGGVIEAVNPTSAAIGEDYGVRAGSNIWLGIAAYHVFRATKDIRYLRFARAEADFALSLQIDDPKDPNDGAIRMGPRGAGQTPGDQHLDFDERMPALYDLVSTENNLDAYALFGMIAHEAPARIKTYAAAQAKVFRWIKDVAYDVKTGRFNRGAHNTVDTMMATDVQCWAISALGSDRIDEFAPEATAKLLDLVAKQDIVTVRFIRKDGVEVNVAGVDFVNADGAKAAGRDRMVSPEWTFQLANAYLRAASGTNTKRYLEKRLALIEGVFAAAVPQGKTLAFPYATLADAPTGHGWNTPADGTLSVVGAAWAVLAVSRFDPLIIPN